MDARARNSTINVLMLPWLAHGHISPFLELARKLTTRNFTIYFCCIPVVLNSIRLKLSPKFSSSIHLVELHLPSLPDLPPHYHTTNGLPPHLMPTLKKAFDMSSPNFGTILKTLKPDLLIYDFLQPWAPAMASSDNIPAVEFLSTSATMIAYVHHHASNNKNRNNNKNNLDDDEFPFPAIYLRDYEKVKLAWLLESPANDDVIKDKDRADQCFEASCGIVLIKTFREIEGKYIDYLTGSRGKKMVPTGPLVDDQQDNTISVGGGDEEMEMIMIKKWLDKKEKVSTVFVSFGSEYFLSQEEMEEIAHGLEMSMANFIWVVRFHAGRREKVNLGDVLPDGFLERVGKRGLVLEGWAPQARILGHPSIGGFVSHCGWSSVMEGMKLGVPIIAMPMHLDQPFNARLVEEVGVGVEVKRDESGRVVREEVARAIREVVVEKNGEGVRRKAREVSETMRRKGDEEIDGVVEELVQLCGKMNLQ